MRHARATARQVEESSTSLDTLRCRSSFNFSCSPPLVSPLCLRRFCSRTYLSVPMGQIASNDAPSNTGAYRQYCSVWLAHRALPNRTLDVNISDHYLPLGYISCPRWTAGRSVWNTDVDAKIYATACHVSANNSLSVAILPVIFVGGRCSAPRTSS